MHDLKTEIHTEVCTYCNEANYLFMSEGVLALSYVYFKHNKLDHPLIKNCKTWCERITDKLMVKVWKDMEDNPTFTPFQYYKNRVNLFFDTTATFTEVTKPLKGELYIADLTIDSKKMCVESDDDLIDYFIYTEQEKYLGLYSIEEGFTLFSQQVNHFNEDEVLSYKLYKVKI